MLEDFLWAFPVLSAATLCGLLELEFAAQLATVQLPPVDSAIGF